MRLVVSDLNEVSAWAQTVDGIHAVGGLAVVQVCDSFELAGMSMTQYRERLDVLISALSAPTHGRSAMSWAATGSGATRWRRPPSLPSGSGRWARRHC